LGRGWGGVFLFSPLTWGGVRGWVSAAAL